MLDYLSTLSVTV